MSQPRFIPLCCPDCDMDLIGRSVDRVAFCRGCNTAVRCDRQELIPLRVRTVSPAVRIGECLALPFWKRGGTIHPAFLSARPLTVARIVSGLSGSWNPAEGLGDSPPLGARILPENLVHATRLARLPEPDAEDPLELLSVECLEERRRIHLPGTAPVLYPDDVIEWRGLAAASR